MVKVHFDEAYKQALKECKSTTTTPLPKKKMHDISQSQVMVCIYLIIYLLFTENEHIDQKEDRHIYVLHPEAYEELLAGANKKKIKSNQKASKRQKISNEHSFLRGSTMENIYFLQNSQYFSFLIDGLSARSDELECYVMIPVFTKANITTGKHSLNNLNLVLVDFQRGAMIVLDPNNDFNVGEDKYSCDKLFQDDALDSYYSPAKGGYKAHKYLARAADFLVKVLNDSMEKSVDPLQVTYYGKSSDVWKEGDHTCEKLFRTLHHIRTFVNVILQLESNLCPHTTTPFDEIICLLRGGLVPKSIEAIVEGNYGQLLSMSIDIATNSTKCFTFSNCVDKEATRMKTDNAPMQSTARPLYRSRSTHFNSIYLYSKAAIDAARAAHYSPYTGDLLKKIDQQQGVNVVCRDEEIVTPPIEVVSSPVADVDVSLTIDLESPGSDNDFSIEGLLEDYNDCQTSVNTIEASDKSTSGTAEARDISPPVNSGVATITENDNCHYSNALLRKDIIVGDEKYVKNTTIPFDCRCTPEEAAEVTTCSRVNPLLGLFFKSDEMHSITFFRSVYIMLHIHGLDFRFRHSYYDIDNPPKTLNEFSNLFFSYEQDAIVTIFKGLENNEENKTISYVKHVFQFEFDLLEKCDVSEGAYCDRVNGMPGAERCTKI
ncbi:unnamed protein product [Ambrosiozyma monospora]|uniref:Unnamed protein product n=1 Tax=Ambrosiozyma monospora TaxID=43982 RepID=A0A9W6Z532_AMBMO|nr:unnamed protein product [Ambrosiozyma monospora]